ncbi:amine oxidase [Flavobacterium cheongpyeongense]|uniref:Tryptophan 2-monooxygenase n=1 Tax=Flavobacterium cheongpyeongense TaxID=2212651 RepID=A0A2V4BQ85_9FLAO|nr:FAD-dependent oxidoreductase [Flavobacterium cheongpyeongense]PXY41186.1 amine oxidase [Flavobacterium cheongpyeongense]
MGQYKSRQEFLKNNPRAIAFSALAEATNMQEKIVNQAIKLLPNQLEGKEVIIIGSGVGGLTTAYELLAQESGAKVTILEASHKTGGRCMSLRTGDTLIEDANSDLFDSKPGKPQVVRFKRPVGDSEPYLNAGPGRIPSSHKRLLSYLKRFSVDVEIYVMNSESNLVQKNKSFGGKPMVYRRLDHNTRGWLAHMVYQNAEELLRNSKVGISQSNLKTRVKELQSLMISFGELDADGTYSATAGSPGFEDGKTRAGYEVLPGVAAGIVADVLSFDKLLESKFWEGTKFYQPSDFLWQPTLFQPVGGMDQVQHAFAQQVAALGGNILLNSPVKKIKWDSTKEKYIISVGQVGTDEPIYYEADYCVCNLAMPFLSEILDEDLLNKNLKSKFKEALKAVFTAQFEPTKAPGYKPREDGYVPRFLACTSKVGWQANRSLWQGSPINLKTMGVEKSEVGVVPIFGGISWTDNEIQQIWYPSTAYQDEKGVLTGAYNFDKVAHDWGKLPVEERLAKARNDASKFGRKFAEGLEDGVAIAWQNMPHIKGGWAYWQAVGNAEYATEQFNTIAQGSGIYDETGKKINPNFFIVGDQISSLPGWQEGAIAAALNAISRMAKPEFKIPYLKNLPDTRLMVEGI